MSANTTSAQQALSRDQALADIEAAVMKLGKLTNVEVSHLVLLMADHAADEKMDRRLRLLYRAEQHPPVIESAAWCLPEALAVIEHNAREAFDPRRTLDQDTFETEWSDNDKPDYLRWNRMNAIAQQVFKGVTRLATVAALRRAA